MKRADTSRLSERDDAFERCSVSMEALLLLQESTFGFRGRPGGVHVEILVIPKLITCPTERFAHVEIQADAKKSALFFS